MQNPISMRKTTNLPSVDNKLMHLFNSKCLSHLVCYLLHSNVVETIAYYSMLLVVGKFDLLPSKLYLITSYSQPCIIHA